MTITALSVWEVASHVVNLAVAYALAVPIGWDREQEERSAGIRTFPLVAVAACGFVLIAIRVLGAASMGQAPHSGGADHGCGLHRRRCDPQTCRPCPPALRPRASLWATGALGAAVGYGLYDIAAILSLVTYLTLRYLVPLKQAARRSGGGHDEVDPEETSSPTTAQLSPASRDRPAPTDPRRLDQKT